MRNYYTGSILKDDSASGLLSFKINVSVQKSTKYLRLGCSAQLYYSV